jgi:hypothetical protein
MRKAEQRGWTKKSAPCYVEEHHVFIKAIFGENSRLVYLTAREHFIAHVLLWKACRKRYGKQHWKTAKTGKSVQAMSMKSQFTSNRQTGRLYEIAKKANSESMSGDLHWPRQEGAVNPLISLNKDPVRAKRIGEINRKREKESWESGNHPFQTPEAIETKRQRMLNGQAAVNGSKTKGKLWWNNGIEQTRAFECPGEEWVRGRLPFDNSKLVEYCKSDEGRLRNRKRNEGKRLTVSHKQAISDGMRRNK